MATAGFPPGHSLRAYACRGGAAIRRMTDLPIGQDTHVAIGQTAGKAGSGSPRWTDHRLTERSEQNAYQPAPKHLGWFLPHAIAPRRGK